MKWRRVDSPDVTLNCILFTFCVLREGSIFVEMCIVVDHKAEGSFVSS